MNWFYATPSKTQAGPVDDAALDALFQQGTITAETLVWAEGMDNWKPYGQVRNVTTAPGPSAVPNAPLAPGEAFCAECGKAFSSHQLVNLAGRHVCAACKPAAMQKFQEGVTTFGQTADPEELWTEVQNRGFDFSIGSVLSRAWELVKGNFWPCLGVTLLAYLIIMASQQIPIAGIAAVFLVQPQMLAGVFWYFLKQFRSQPATLNDSFDGFRSGFGQQAIYMLILMGIILVVVLVMVIPMALLIPALSAASKDGDVPYMLILIMSVIGIPLVLASWYFMTCLLFAPILILDKGLKAMPAMKLSLRVVRLRIWKIIGLLLVISLLGLAGMMVLCVGLLVVLPVGFAAIARLYEDAFGDQTHPAVR